MLKISFSQFVFKENKNSERRPSKFVDLKQDEVY